MNIPGVCSSSSVLVLCRSSAEETFSALDTTKNSRMKREWLKPELVARWSS